VNHSFSVDDSTLQYHLKITDDLESVRKLHSWHKIHSLLEERYRAPKVIDWIDFPEIGFSGLLQEHINGRTANFRDSPFLLSN